MKKAILAIAVAVAATLGAAARTVSIDLRGDTGRAKGARTVLSKGTLRKVNLDAGVTDVGAVATGDILEFRLFDDVAVTLTLGEKMPSPLGGDVFIATAEGYDGVSNAVVLRNPDGLTVDIRDYLRDKVYKVISSASGVTVREMTPSHDGKCACGESHVAEAAPVPAKAKPRAKGVDQTDTCVDILVAYDRNAAAYANSSSGGLVNFAQLAVQNMNGVLANTGLDKKFRFRLVGVTTLDAAASDVNEALHAIDSGESGWDEIWDAREKYGADIVSTLIDTGSASGSTGVGKSLSSEWQLSSFDAINVCSIRAVETSTTMAHECGHNLGAGHSDMQFTQPGPQLYDYSAGYFFTAAGEACCTVMAYGHENPSGVEATELPFFSSPSHSYHGYAVGNSTHDNTKTLEQTFSYAANWQPQRVPLSYDVIFSPASGDIFDGSLTVTLEPGKAGTEIRYTLDGSTPDLTSPVYSGPITITERTTIMAVTVNGSDVSLPYAATYYSSNDIGYATGLMDLKWSQETPAGSTCGVQTDVTIDGVGIGATVADGSACKFRTTIKGPATLSWWWVAEGSIEFEVASDETSLFYENWWGNSLWEKAMVDIPAGEHVVEFRLGSYEDGTKFWLDDFSLVFTPMPKFSPAPANPGDAITFEGEQMVSLIPPSDDCKIFYTLDGSEPSGEHAIPYDGPFFISEATVVKAVAARSGTGVSAVAECSFIEESVGGPGEWTLNGAAAYSKAQVDGRLVAELNWNFPGCGWSFALEPVITDPAFTTWAELNGIYLFADSWGDKPQAIGDKFWYYYDDTSLSTELGGYVYWPTFVLVDPDDTSTCLGAMMARDDGIHTANGIYYTGTVSSLAECLASFLGASAPLDPPEASVTEATAFPFDVTLVNNNGTGTMYYTLDGSSPTPANGTSYAGPITIEHSGTILKAAVWTDDPAAVSGIPLVIEYYEPATPWPLDAPPPQVVGLTGDSTYLEGALLRWSAAESAASYNIYRGETEDFTSAVLVGSTQQLRFWDMSGDAGKVYYYFVCGVNHNGEGAPSDCVTASRLAVYKVSFDPNGGSGTIASLDVVSGKSCNLPNGSFTKTGFTCDGWATSPTGDIAYSFGASFSPSSNVTLYAHWKPVSKPDPVTPDKPDTPDTPVTPVTPDTPKPPVPPEPPTIVPDETPTPICGDEPTLHTDAAIADDQAYSAAVAGQFSGYVADSSGKPAGTIIVKVGKGNNNTGISKITATVIMADVAKKLNFKGEGAPIDDAFTCTLRCSGEEDLTLNLREGAVVGDWKGGKVYGSPNVFTSKKPGAANLAASASSAWMGAPVNVVWIDNGYNVMSLAIGSKGKVKATGFLADGTKLTGSAQLTVGDEWLAIPVAINKKAHLAFVVWLSRDGNTVRVDGLGDDAKGGRVQGLADNSLVAVDSGTISEIIGSSAFSEYYPNGVKVGQNGLKWIVASGVKAGKVVYLKGTTEIDEAKAGANPSALKLSYTAKNGTFKGSFKAYALINGKPKAFSFKVSGALVGNVAYGTATQKKMAAWFRISAK